MGGGASKKEDEPKVMTESGSMTKAMPMALVPWPKPWRLPKPWRWPWPKPKSWPWLPEVMALDHFGVPLESHKCHFGVIFGSAWGILGSFRGHFLSLRVILGSLWV